MLAGVFGFGAPTAGDAVRAAVRAAGERRAGANDSTSRNGSKASSVSGPSARAHEFLGELGRRVAIGVASVSVVLDPGLVVLGGDIGLAGGTALADLVAAEVARICPASPRVVPTAVTGAPVLRGALLAAVDQARTDLLDSVLTARPRRPGPAPGRGRTGDQRRGRDGQRRLTPGRKDEHGDA